MRPKPVWRPQPTQNTSSTEIEFLQLAGTKVVGVRPKGTTDIKERPRSPTPVPIHSADGEAPLVASNTIPVVHLGRASPSIPPPPPPTPPPPATALSASRAPSTINLNESETAIDQMNHRAWTAARSSDLASASNSPRKQIRYVISFEDPVQTHPNVTKPPRWTRYARA